ncbi:quercetin dioxygenase-like cupin family protein [Inquilinus ginsengisoli]|uniref:Quercetin dioxygenase-like cupin family protein n=1 Tax=Inquilinus ginsengisoli TaxID=363840 RepID=A0ABU1JJ82_9PROT|nr:cupin domain-containing protein [Inquilinus ginsengisoli]MDR6287614.1 quercetin dioxygenase-like cupin family protein [Inquilinus ginsengisoli]
MTSNSKRVLATAALAGMLALGFAGGQAWTAVAAAARGETVTPLTAQKLANIPGKTLTALTVDYAPGGASPAHHHAASATVFAYVVSGAIRSQVNGGPTAVFQAGQFWIEPPGSAHGVSENASTTEPAKLVAIAVGDDGATLTTFDK